MANKEYYLNLCIEALEEMALDEDIDAIVLLIEENYKKQKWLTMLTEIIKRKPGEDDLKDIVYNERRKAAQRLLKLSKKMNDEVELTAESIKKSREIE